MKSQDGPNRTVGLTMSGGGARGFFHCGVIDALIEHGLRPDWVSGSSAGSIVAVLYAAGVPMQDVMARFPDNLSGLFRDSAHLLKLRFDPMKALRDYLYHFLGDIRFDELNCNARIAAVHAGRGEVHLFGA